MKRVLIKSLLAAGVLLSVGCIAGTIILQQPVFGKLPEGERLTRIKASSNYKGGEFQNLETTPLLTNGATELSIRIDNLLADKGEPRPLHAIPVLKTDMRSLDPQLDVAIWLGHSSWYLQVAGKKILVDPVFSEYAAPFPGLISSFEGSNVYALEDIPQIDLLLITHDHYDHLDFPTIEALRPLVRDVVVGLGGGAHFEYWGYDESKIHELDWYDNYQTDNGIVIHATPARHYSGRGLTRNQSLWVGYALESPKRRLFISGDTGAGEHFKLINQRYGPFDWATIDSGQYDARWAHLHMNPEEAAQAASELGARAVTPSHVGRFSLASHDWSEPFKRFTRAAQKRSYAVWTPMIGQPLYFDGRAQKFAQWWEAAE